MEKRKDKGKNKMANSQDLTVVLSFLSLVCLIALVLVITWYSSLVIKTLLLILRSIFTMEDRLAQELIRLEGIVNSKSTVFDSAVTTLQEVAGLMRQHSTDADRVRSLADAIDQKATALAAAMVTNTVAEGQAGEGPGGSTPSSVSSTGADTGASAGDSGGDSGTASNVDAGVGVGAGVGVVDTGADTSPEPTTEELNGLEGVDTGEEEV